MYKCKKCASVCETADEFRKHFTQHLEPHQRSSNTYKIDVPENSTCVYHCRLCDINLDENEYKRHSEKHGRKVCKICDTCGKVYTIYSSWFRHQQLHHVEKSGNLYICKVCGKTFTFASLLRTHMKVHSKERPHVCEICGKSFKTNRHLVRHRFTHSDVKPLSCEYCGKGFASTYNLKCHRRTHTGEKPYKCDVCKASFTHNISLKTHKRSVHGIDMWKGQKPPGSQEIDDINVKDPELYKLRKLIDASKTTDPECSSRPPDIPLESYIAKEQVTETSYIEGQPSKSSVVKKQPKSKDVAQSSEELKTSASIAAAGNNKELFHRKNHCDLSSDSYVSVPIRPPPLDPTPRMQLVPYSQSQNTVPNFQPVANSPGLYQPLLGYSEMANNDHQNVQPPLVHSTSVPTPISAHGYVHSSVHSSAQSSALDTARSVVGYANNHPAPSTQAQPQRTGNRWSNGATGRQFTDL